MSNNCNGSVTINNNQKITLPSIGKTNSYKVDFEKPCFFINNHFLSPILRCHNVILSNPVTLEFCDKIRIKIKIPKQILGKTYGYSLDCLTNELIKNNFSAGLQFKSSDGCIDATRCIDNDNELEIEDFCGWINITIHYQIGSDEDNLHIERICNLCEISYSLCFEPVKIKALYGVCYDHIEEVVNFKSETCLEFENLQANRFIDISDYNTVSTLKVRIIGPENFVCLKLTYNETKNIIYDKFSKILFIEANVINNSDFDNINNNLPNNFHFVIQCYEDNKWVNCTEDISLDELLNNKLLSTNYIKLK